MKKSIFAIVVPGFAVLSVVAAPSVPPSATKVPVPAQSVRPASAPAKQDQDFHVKPGAQNSRPRKHQEEEQKRLELQRRSAKGSPPK